MKLKKGGGGGGVCIYLNLCKSLLFAGASLRHSILLSFHVIVQRFGLGETVFKKFLKLVFRNLKKIRRVSAECKGLWHNLISNYAQI